MTDSWLFKLDRAQKHLDEFDREVALYLDKRAYRPVRTRTKCRDHRDCWRYHLEMTEQPNPNLAVILGDVTHNLRSALDHIAVGLAPRRRKYNASFPIISEDIEYGFVVPSKAQLEARQRFDSAVQGMKANAVAIIQRAQPYHLGPQSPKEVHLLGVLSRLDNADKHRQLIVLSSGLMNPKVTATTRRSQRWASADAPNVFVETGAELLHFGTDHLSPPVREAEMNVQVRGAPVVAADVGLGSEAAFPVEGIHELIPEMRAMLAALDPDVRRAKPKN